MKGRVGGELEELRKPKKFEALEKCSETAVPKSGEPKQPGLGETCRIPPTKRSAARRSSET